MSRHGHFWTVAPYLRHRFRPVGLPRATPWSTLLEDPKVGPVQLHGLLAHAQGARTLVVLVHGLGGGLDSGYLRACTRAAHDFGFATLRLALRGADRAGRDFYHAALTADLRAALASPEVQQYACIFLLGFSLGGHLCLYYASEDHDPRLRAVAAICPPLDLKPVQQAIDAAPLNVYRRHVLDGLKEIYRGVAAQGSVPTPLREALSIRRIYEWDRQVIVPRFGFDSVEDYYTRASAGPRLGRIGVPALIVAAREDPMVPFATLRPFLDAPNLTVRAPRSGGHTYFPRDLHLGFAEASGLPHQAVGWLADV